MTSAACSWPTSSARGRGQRRQRTKSTPMTTATASTTTTTATTTATASTTTSTTTNRRLNLTRLRRVPGHAPGSAAAANAIRRRRIAQSCRPRSLRLGPRLPLERYPTADRSNSDLRGQRHVEQPRRCGWTRRLHPPRQLTLRRDATRSLERIIEFCSSGWQDGRAGRAGESRGKRGCVRSFARW